MSKQKELVAALTALGFGTDNEINGADVVNVVNEHFYSLKSSVESDAKRYADSCKLQDIGKSAYEGIAEMVAALECDYDRLEELRDERQSARDDDSDDPGALSRWDESDEAKELLDLESAAGECTSREEAKQRIHEDALSVEVRTDWHTPGDRDATASEFTILLGTGGPAMRIMGELNEHGEPVRAWIQAQDWFQLWTDYVGGDSDTLLTYCRCFYFGEG